MVLFIMVDSLRLDMAHKYLKGIFPEESWSVAKSVNTFTAPCLATLITGKSEEETGVHWFEDSVNPEACKDTLFHNFNSWITSSRLIGNGPKWMPPSRRDRLKFLPPIDFHAETNAELGGMEYIARKYSMASDDYWDLIFWHAWSCHGPWGIPEYGPKEIPALKNCDRLMQRMTHEELINWYTIGVLDFKCILTAIRDITNNQELIILVADHGEDLKDTPEGITGHQAGRQNVDIMSKVPFWVNRKIDLPELVKQEDIKDLVVKLYNEYERDNKDYQKWKSLKEGIQATKGHEITLNELAKK